MACSRNCAPKPRAGGHGARSPGWRSLPLFTLLAQLVSALLFLLWWETAFPFQPLDLAEIESNGPLLGVVTLVSTIAVFGIVALAVRLSRNSLKNYLALRWPSPRSLAAGLGLTALLLLAADFVTVQSGRDVIPDFMTEIYATSRDAGMGFFFLLAITLIVLAPLGEEIIFRGFFYRGLSSGFGPFAAIIVTAAVWSVMHAQYEGFFMAQIFAYGLFLGWMRWRSDSLILVIIPSRHHQCARLGANQFGVWRLSLGLFASFHRTHQAIDADRQPKDFHHECGEIPRDHER